MSWLASASTAPWERALSWTLILAVWQTSLLALLVRGAFHFLGRPGPRQRYAVAWTALWVALLCAGASLWAAARCTRCRRGRRSSPLPRL